jgi:hypothetical protein
MMLALFTAAALAQQAPETRYTSIFHFDRFGNVESMEGCVNGRCRELDLRGVIVVPSSDLSSFSILDEEGTEIESWDPCQYDYNEQISICDEFILPKPCECSEPYEWEGQA